MVLHGVPLQYAVLQLLSAGVMQLQEGEGAASCSTAVLQGAALTSLQSPSVCLVFTS